MLLNKLVTKTKECTSVFITSQKFKIEHSAKIGNALKPFTIFEKRWILDVQLNSEYLCGLFI